MARENRMTREDYLNEIEKVNDTAYAEQGNPQTFGNVNQSHHRSSTFTNAPKMCNDVRNVFESIRTRGHLLGRSSGAPGRSLAALGGRSWVALGQLLAALG